MAADFDRLVHLLDTHRPGEDASALAALIPLARRRGEPALLERLARCFVDTKLTALPGHRLSAPSELGASAEMLGRAATTLATWSAYRWQHTRLLLREQPAEDALAADAIALLQRLGAEPASALESDAVEAVAWTLWDGPERYRLVDRWIEQGSLERAARILASTAAWRLERYFDDGQVIGLELHGAPDEHRFIAHDGLVRLWAWLRVEPALAPPADALLAAMLETGALELAAVEAAVALWLAELEPELIDRAVARLSTPGATWNAVALAPLVAALRPGHGDALQTLLAWLASDPEHVADLLAAAADRLAGEALVPLTMFRARASHHKYVSLAAAAIARIPGRETVRHFAPELGHKARSRAEDARTACLLQPVDALLELPDQIAALAADTARKGKAERARQIEAMGAMLEELARSQPGAAWILLPTIRDAALHDRIAAAIPEEHRRDPLPDEAEAGAETTGDWLAHWPVPPDATAPALLVEPCGALDREQVRRVALALREPATRGERLDQLAAHLEPDNRARLADALLEGWNTRARRRYADVWVFQLAARFADAGTRERLRTLLLALFDDGDRGPLGAAIEQLGGEAARSAFGNLHGPLGREPVDDAHDARVRAGLDALVDSLPRRA